MRSFDAEWFAETLRRLQQPYNFDPRRCRNTWLVVEWRGKEYGRLPICSCCGSRSSWGECLCGRRDHVWRDAVGALFGWLLGEVRT